MNAQVVFDECCNRVNIKLLRAHNHTIAIDGTSCTKKSSIAKATKRPVTKTQMFRKFWQPDTYFPSMLGYICYGIRQNMTGGLHVCDRSPLNVWQWHILWKQITYYTILFGNTKETLPPIGYDYDAAMTSLANEFIESTTPSSRCKKQTKKNHQQHKYSKKAILFARHFDRVFGSQPYLTELFSDHINCIALIDSCTERCDSLRHDRKSLNARRNVYEKSKSDSERSKWTFYTMLQNRMYQLLYPELHIDLAWFQGCSDDDMVQGIAMFINHVLDNHIAKLPCPPATIDRYSLPTQYTDFHMMNIRTHVHRSIGRWGSNILCRKAADNNSNSNSSSSSINVNKKQTTTITASNQIKRQDFSDDADLVGSSDVDDSTELTQAEELSLLSAAIPKYLRVSNVKHSSGHMMPTIEPYNIESLLRCSEEMPMASVDEMSKYFDDDENNSNASSTAAPGKRKRCDSDGASSSGGSSSSHSGIYWSNNANQYFTDDDDDEDDKCSSSSSSSSSNNNNTEPEGVFAMDLEKSGNDEGAAAAAVINSTTTTATKTNKCGKKSQQQQQKLDGIWV